jgi:hypothetical protein
MEAQSAQSAAQIDVLIKQRSKSVGALSQETRGRED